MRTHVEMPCASKKAPPQGRALRKLHTMRPVERTDHDMCLGAAHHGDAMRERGAAAAGQRVQAAARHCDGLAGRQQHFRAVAVERDHRHLA